MQTCCDEFHGEILSLLTEKQQTQNTKSREQVFSVKGKWCRGGEQGIAKIFHMNLFSKFESRQLDLSVFQDWSKRQNELTFLLYRLHAQLKLQEETNKESEKRPPVRIASKRRRMESFMVKDCAQDIARVKFEWAAM